MGMSDTVYVRFQHPIFEGCEPSSKTQEQKIYYFQSKSFGGHADHYVLDEAGNLTKYYCATEFKAAGYYSYPHIGSIEIYDKRERSFFLTFDEGKLISIKFRENSTGNVIEIQPGGKTYFLDQDDSCHWYIVESNHREDWENWLAAIYSEDQDWDDPIPDFAHRIGGSPSIVEFHSPTFPPSR